MTPLFSAVLFSPFLQVFAIFFTFSSVFSLVFCFIITFNSFSTEFFHSFLRVFAFLSQYAHVYPRLHTYSTYFCAGVGFTELSHTNHVFLLFLRVLPFRFLRYFRSFTHVFCAHCNVRFSLFNLFSARLHVFGIFFCTCPFFFYVCSAYAHVYVRLLSFSTCFLRFEMFFSLLYMLSTHFNDFYKDTRFSRVLHIFGVLLRFFSPIDVHCNVILCFSPSFCTRL